MDIHAATLGLVQGKSRASLGCFSFLLSRHTALETAPTVLLDLPMSAGGSCWWTWSCRSAVTTVVLLPAWWGERDSLEEASHCECGRARISACGWKKTNILKRCNEKLTFINLCPPAKKLLWCFLTQKAPQQCWFSNGSHSTKFLFPPSSSHGFLLLDVSPVLWAGHTWTCCTSEGEWDGSTSAPRITKPLRLELRSPSPTTSPSQPCPLTYIPRCHIARVLKHLKGRWLHHIPAQPVQKAAVYNPVRKTQEL